MIMTLLQHGSAKFLSELLLIVHLPLVLPDVALVGTVHIPLIQIVPSLVFGRDVHVLLSRWMVLGERRHPISRIPITIGFLRWAKRIAAVFMAEFGSELVYGWY